MFRSNLAHLITVLSLMFVSAISSAESDSNGLVAIWKGDFVNTPSNGFVGTGFHIGNGYVVTAKHVLENIGDEWFGVVASKNAIGNRVKVASAHKCVDEADICIFQLDPTDATIRNDELSKPYGITCELPTPWPQVEMVGFSAESDGPKLFKDISIQSKSGTFQAPNGLIYSKMLQTNAQTSPGTSGSPVVIIGTRNAIGVHVAFSDETKDQIVFPFYLLSGTIQVEGAKVFHPDVCASGTYLISNSVALERSFSVELDITILSSTVERVTKTTKRYGVSTGSLVETKCRTYSIAPTAGWNIDPASVSIVSRTTQGSNSATINRRTTSEAVAEFCARSIIKDFRKQTGDSFGKIQYSEFRHVDAPVVMKVTKNSSESATNVVRIELNGELVAVSGIITDSNGEAVQISNIGENEGFSVTHEDQYLIIDREI